MLDAISIYLKHGANYAGNLPLAPDFKDTAILFNNFIGNLSEKEFFEGFSVTSKSLGKLALNTINTISALSNTAILFGSAKGLCSKTVALLALPLTFVPILSIPASTYKLIVMTDRAASGVLHLNQVIKTKQSPLRAAILAGVGAVNSLSELQQYISNHILDRNSGKPSGFMDSIDLPSGGEPTYSAVERDDKKESRRKILS